MNKHRPEQNHHGGQLQRELRKLRIEAGLTLAEAGLRAHIDMKKLSRLEIHQLPTYHELVLLLDVYCVVSTDVQEYLDLWRLARQQSWWCQYARRDSRYLRMEGKAAAKTEFQRGFLPTLLQTEAYAYRSLEAIADPSVRDNLVAVRMRQQQRLFSGDRQLWLHALVHQSALRQGVDKSQLTYLLECSELPNVTFQIVPNCGGAHLGLRGSVILLTFDDGKEPDTVFTETHIGLSEAQEPDRVSTIKRVLDKVTSHALSPSGSTAVLHKLIAGCR